MCNCRMPNQMRVPAAAAPQTLNDEVKCLVKLICNSECRVDVVTEYRAGVPFNLTWLSGVRSPVTLAFLALMDTATHLRVG
jgi:hypothetical protein